MTDKLYPVKKVASWFIKTADQDYDEIITPLKLQKLVYYAQAWMLALHDRPLFADDFQAWPHGPAIPALYGMFKEYQYNPIPADAPNVSTTALKFDDEALDILRQVRENYGIYDGKYLETLTHSERPWMETRRGLSPEAPCNRVISKDLMKEYYRSMASSESE